MTFSPQPRKKRGRGGKIVFILVAIVAFIFAVIKLQPLVGMITGAVHGDHPGISQPAAPEVNRPAPPAPKNLLQAMAEDPAFHSCKEPVGNLGKPNVSVEVKYQGTGHPTDATPSPRGAFAYEPTGGGTYVVTASDEVDPAHLYLELQTTRQASTQHFRVTATSVLVDPALGGRTKRLEICGFKKPG
jgi:hypothetical protein